MVNNKSISNVLMPKILLFGFWVSFVIWILAFGIWVDEARAATLSLQPSTGTFQVGSTFEVSVYIDTQKETINAIEAYLHFPADKLQLVSPATGSSIIDLWISQPKYNNAAGTIELRGGIPQGVNVSKGLVSTLMFRVRDTGSALVSFADNSRVLLNDGQGTDKLQQTYSGVFSLVLPPPAGPVVVSETHPVQTEWYADNDLAFTWSQDEGVDGYSYVLSQEPIAIPDGISEGTENGVRFRDVADGRHYFHLKALRSGIWGGATHFAARVDTTPPAEFPIEIFPSQKTTERRPTIQFQTTDAASGLNRYEVKIVPLKQENASGKEESQPFFFEVESPYIASALELGTYDVIVRTYDNAGNFRDVPERLSIVTPLFEVVGQDGVHFRNMGTVPWPVLWTVIGILAVLFALLGLVFRKKFKALHAGQERKQFPDALQKQLEELKKYQRKYGKLAIVLVFGVSLLLAGCVKPGFTHAQQQEELSPPVISQFARNISNDEIFYAGGVTEFPRTRVVIFLQNEQSGELTSRSINSDERGEWFYQHDTFLAPGSYFVWAQGERGEEKSAPSSHREFSVTTGAFEFAGARVSYEVIALLVSIVLLLALLGTGLFMFTHMRAARRKHKEFQKEMREAQESIRRGFAVLKRDIQSELAIVKRAGLGKGLSAEQKKQEDQLLRDLAWAETYIGKEVWDVKDTEHHD